LKYIGKKKGKKYVMVDKIGAGASGMMFITSSMMEG